ncbi:P-loop NTPase fold protein [Klebsiella aerogenes]
MSLEFIKKQIADFLSLDHPEVMAIQGEWGVGKTYSWNMALQENKDKIKCSRYSYVSLFGINSLDNLKYSIFENTIQKSSIGTEPSLETVRDNALGIGEILGRKTAKIAKEIPIVKNFASTIDSVSFMTIKNMIVVIDDLERRGKNLEVKDVLGLISLLKEHKECKVVLLLNNNTSGMEEYKTYKEKVIDRDVTFSPSAEECAMIAFDNKSEYFNQLSKYSVSLGIKNIRILKKINRFIKMVEPFLPKADEILMKNVAHSLTLFTWSQYAFSAHGDIPSLDFIFQTQNIYTAQSEKNETNKKWSDTLLKYGYIKTDYLDEILIDIVRFGYVDSEELIKRIQWKINENKRGKLRGSLSNAWDIYHCSFDDNAEDVVTSMFDAVRQGVDYVTPNEMNNVISLFRDLAINDKATELIDIYINARNDHLMEHINSDLKGFGYITDQEFREKVEQLEVDLENNDTLEGALSSLIGQSGWSDKQFRIISKATADDFYHLFKKNIAKNGSALIATALKFGDFTNSTDEMNLIAEKAREALFRIGNESHINKLRVARYV